MFGWKINFWNRQKQEKKSGLFFNAFEIAKENSGKMIRVVPLGAFPNHHDGAHVIEARHIQEMAANIQKSGTDILFDYGHESLWSAGARAAGWSPKTNVEARADGLYVEYPTFTKAASEAVEGGEFRYFSPVYAMNSKDKQGREAGAILHSIALVNKPYMDTEINHVANSEEIMNPEIKKQLLATLNLPESATDEEIKAALAAKEKQGQEQGQQKEGQEQGQQGQEQALANALQKAIEPIIARLQTLEAKANQDSAAQLEAAVNAAIAEYKILPRDKDVYLTALRANYAETAKKLAEIPKGAVKPQNIQGQEPGPGRKKNSLEAATEFMLQCARKPQPKN